MSTPWACGIPGREVCPCLPAFQKHLGWGWRAREERNFVLLEALGNATPDSQEETIEPLHLGRRQVGSLL